MLEAQALHTVLPAFAQPHISPRTVYGDEDGLLHRGICLAQLLQQAPREALVQGLAPHTWFTTCLGYHLPRRVKRKISRANAQAPEIEHQLNVSWTTLLLSCSGTCACIYCGCMPGRGHALPCLPGLTPTWQAATTQASQQRCCTPASYPPQWQLPAMSALLHGKQGTTIAIAM